MVKRSLSFFMAILLCFGLFRLTMGKDSHIDFVPALNELSKLDYDLTYLIALADDSGQSAAVTFLDVMLSKTVGNSFSDLSDGLDGSINGTIFDFLLSALNYLCLAVEKVYLAVSSIGSVLTDSYENLRVIFKSIAILVS